MKLTKKNDQKMVTMSKTRLNIGASLIQIGGMVYGAALMSFVLDSFMDGAIGDKVADTIDRLHSKRRSRKDHEIRFEGTRTVSDEFMAKIMKAPVVPMSELEKTAGDDCDPLAEITDLADYDEACRLAGRKIDPEEWEAWKKNANFSMDALRIYYGAAE